MEWWSGGVMEWWSDGVLECWSDGVVELGRFVAVVKDWGGRSGGHWGIWG
jgi:hypothetical protein